MNNIILYVTKPTRQSKTQETHVLVPHQKNADDDDDENWDDHGQ